MSLHQCPTLLQAGGIFTKAFTNAEKWIAVCELIGITDNRKPRQQIQQPKPVVKTPKAVKNPRGDPKPASPATTHNRAMIEYCCGPDSLLGQKTRQSEGCIVHRITQKEDATSDAGHELGMKLLDEPKTMLFASMPCTGGSAWMNINKLKPGGMEIYRGHRKLLWRIWARFEDAAKEGQWQ